MLAETIPIVVPVWKMILALSLIVSYPICIWFCAYYMAKDLMYDGKVGTDMQFIIFLLSLVWPLVVCFIIGRNTLPRLWNLLGKLYGLLPKCLRKALYWMQFAIRPIRLAEVLGERRQKKLYL